MLSRTRLCIGNIPRRLMATNQRNLDLTGVFPPVATPFDKDENISSEKFVENLKKWDKIPFKGLHFLV